MDFMGGYDYGTSDTKEFLGDYFENIDSNPYGIDF
jgi:hypothetical protein